jgi:hypothetical protein
LASPINGRQKPNFGKSTCRYRFDKCQQNPQTLFSGAGVCASVKKIIISRRTFFKMSKIKNRIIMHFSHITKKE